MNLFTKALGFSNFNSEIEDEFIKTGIEESLKEGFVIRHVSLNRGVIVLRLSSSTGLYIYGRFVNDEFIYEYYFPFIVGKRFTDNEEITVERHLDKESFAVVCDETKTGITLIFYLQNVMDYLEFISKCDGFKPELVNFGMKHIYEHGSLKNKKAALTALSLGGIIMLPIRKEPKSQRMMEEDDNRNSLIQAARHGDEEAIESLTLEDIDTYNKISMRVQKEDIFTIVDSTFMPCGVECDQYSVIGEILELNVEENIYTGEKIVIMVIECNNLIITLAINRAHLLGEPAVGRRFKGQIWLQGNVRFTE